MKETFFSITIESDRMNFVLKEVFLKVNFRIKELMSVAFLSVAETNKIHLTDKHRKGA